MSDTLRHLYKFIRSFGKMTGLYLAIRYKFNRTKDLKLPGIKEKLSLRSNTTDKATFYQVFIKKQYNIALPKKPEVLIDGGANIGLFTILIKNKYPNAKIICIEPDPENFDLLRKNVLAYENVYCENCGLWNRDTLLNVYDKYNGGKCALIVEEDKEGKIKSISLDTLMKKYSLDRIDVLKLDIETSEKNLFTENFQNWLSKTKVIIIELHDWMEAGCAKAFFQAINKTIKSYSYSHSGENVVIINNDLD
jgi:FkbM family methyltransferase